MQLLTIFTAGDNQLPKPPIALPKIATAKNRITKNSKSTIETPKTPC